MWRLTAQIPEVAWAHLSPMEAIKSAATTESGGVPSPDPLLHALAAADEEERRF